MSEISIPQKLIVTFRIVFDISKIPPEKLEQFKLRDYKTWAREFKEDMEGDHEFGPFTKVTFETEEVI